MKTYTLHVSWTMTATMTLQADNEADARKQANDAPLPTSGDYLADSFQVDEVEETQ
jgi:hypothetical protein